MDLSALIELPRELQVNIFKQLSPAELVAFETFGPGNHFYYLSFEKGVVWKTDLCHWTHTSLKAAKAYLLKENRWKNIRELCLNDLIGRLPSGDFFKQLTFNQKFRELRSLHMVNCSVPLEKLQGVIAHLTHLTELSWSLMVHKLPEKTHCFGQVKTVHLETYLHGSLRHKQAVMHVLKWFPNLEYLSIHFSFLIHPIGSNSNHECARCSFKKLHSFVCTSETFHMFHGVQFYDNPVGNHAEGVIQTILEQRDMNKPWKRLWILNSSRGMHLHKLVGNETPVIGVRNVSIQNEEPQPIMEIGGPNVRFVQLDSCTIVSDINQEEFLKNFFTLCCNVTELNLFNTHFDPLSYPCRAIALLHNLKKLLVPICCVFTGEYEIRLPNSRSRAKKPRISHIKESSEDARVPLTDIVEGCPEIIELDIRQFIGDTLCPICRGNARGKHPEDDLVPLHKMKKLSSLTIVGIQANRMPQGKFLEAISNAKKDNNDFCRDLNTLRLYFVGPQGNHVYMKALKSAFISLHCLRDISLQHSSLCLESSFFWNTFSRVSGLERLCIATNFTEHLPIKFIQAFMSKVRKLYVLHIHSRASNFKIATTMLRRFAEELNPGNENRPEMEIIIQHLTMHIGLMTTERIRHDGRYIHIRELCVPGSNIAQTHHKCGMKAIL